MANTVMNVALSDAYKANLTAGGSGNGAYAWAFAFDGTPATKLRRSPWSPTASQRSTRSSI